VLDECAAARGAFALEQLDAQREPWCPLTATPTAVTGSSSTTSGESQVADVTSNVADYTTDAAVQWQAVVEAVTRQVPRSVRPPPGSPGECTRGQLKVCVVGPTVGSTVVPTALVEAAAWCGLAVCSMAGAHAAAAAAVSEAEAAAAAAEAARLQVHMCCNVALALSICGPLRAHLPALLARAYTVGVSMQ
jgi:hypothetical protein